MKDVEWPEYRFEVVQVGEVFDVRLRTLVKGALHGLFETVATRDDIPAAQARLAQRVDSVQFS